MSNEYYFSIRPSNLIEPVKVNSKYLIDNNYVKKPYSDEAFYKDLNNFNNKMIDILNCNNTSKLEKYMHNIDKSYENYEYKSIISKINN